MLFGFPMIRHMVLFRFKPDTPAATRDSVLDQLHELPAHFPTMRRFGLGENISKRDDRFTHVMTIEFEERQQLDAYLDSPRHESFVLTHFRPHIEERVIASYET